MIRKFWNYITDPDEIASGITVISSIFVSCAGLGLAFLA